MATKEEATTSDLGLPPGGWEVDPSSSRLEFIVKTMWGMAKVRGHFSAYRGQLLVGDGGGYGELRIDSKTLDTGNEKRDEHLRTDDFFDVEKFPELVFQSTGVKATGDGNLLVSGTLKLPRADVPMELPVTVARGQSGRLRVSAKTTVSRKDAGMEWNRIGVIVGDITLIADLELIPDEQGGAS
jgi:polyisoprenoid-binding protein YceI